MTDYLQYIAREVLSEFPHLQILLLHGNKITEPHEILNLVSCKALKKLALHGNPIESFKVRKKRGYFWKLSSMGSSRVMVKVGQSRGRGCSPKKLT